MGLELLCNLVLFVFFAICLITVGGVVDVDSSIVGSDVMGAALWPQIILALLLITLTINIVKIVKTTKANPEKAEIINSAILMGFVRSKLFIGILLVAAASILMDPLGFIITTFLFLCGYGYLLGRKKLLGLALISLLATFLLFFLFSKGLSVMLPRGYGPIRDFSLFFEMI